MQLVHFLQRMIVEMKFRKLLVCAVLFTLMTNCESMITESASSKERIIEYSNADGTYSLIFIGNKVFSGFEPLLVHDQSLQMRAERKVVGEIKCISISTGGETQFSYAVTNPMELGKKYQCENTKFEILKCNGGAASCEVALVRGRYFPPMVSDKSQFQEFLMYADYCRGIISIIDKYENEKKFEFGRSLELRDRTGILADTQSKECRIVNDQLNSLKSR